MNEIQAIRMAKALDALPAGPWEAWSSNSYRRITAFRGVDGGVLEGRVQSDGHPDLSMSEKQLKALCDLRNLCAEIMGRK